METQFVNVSCECETIYGWTYDAKGYELYVIGHKSIQNIKEQNRIKKCFVLVFCPQLDLVLKRVFLFCFLASKHKKKKPPKTRDRMQKRKSVGDKKIVWWACFQRMRKF